MKNQTVVNRYARALMNLGLADGQYANYGLELKEFSAALASLGAEAEVLTSPVQPAPFRRNVLDLILAKAALSPLAANFVRLLMDKGRLAELNEVVAAYNRLVDEERGLARAKLICAAPLKEDEIGAIRATLSKFSGRQVELTVDCDPELIGGVTAQLGDLIIDGSLRAQIGKLTECLARLS